MPSTHRSASRRLERAARPLKPTTAPYYMHNPRPGKERFGPGWYWVPAGGGEPEYLAVNTDAALYVVQRAAEDLAAAAGDVAEEAEVFQLRPGLAQVAA
jgi:hypothetical protein